MKNIIPECHVDTTLIETLTESARQYSHQKGCPAVAKTMQTFFADNFAVGIIDKDKVEIKYLQEFEQLIAHEGNLELWRHKDASRHHYFIKICPAAEVWILKRAAEESIDLNNHQLPINLAELCDVTKGTPSPEVQERLIRLFKALKKSSNPIVNTLTFWLTHLKEHRFQADLETLKQA